MVAAKKKKAKKKKAGANVNPSTHEINYNLRSSLVTSRLTSPPPYEIIKTY